MCYFKSTIQCSAPTANRFVRLEDRRRDCSGRHAMVFGKTAKDPVIGIIRSSNICSRLSTIVAMTRIAQNEVKQRADTAYYERMFAMLQEVDIYQINELSKHIQRAINELPPTYREAFIMHRFQNLSYKEAAELLNVSPKTVDYRIQQALKILRVKLKDYLPLILMHLLTSH